jgi:protein-L-isoaspartate O-methyltransferase
MRLIEELVNVCGTPTTILDVGSGCGYVTCLLAEAFRIPGRELSVTGLEISPWMVQEARQNVSESYPNLRVKFVNGCMTRLTPSESFDAIHVGFAVPDINCLECVIARLKPRGWMIAPLSPSSVGDFKKMRSIKKFLPNEDAAMRIILGNNNSSEAARLHGKQTRRAVEMERRMQFQHLQLIHRKKDGKLEHFFLPIKYPSSLHFGPMKTVQDLSKTDRSVCTLDEEYPPEPYLKCHECYRNSFVVEWDIVDIETRDCATKKSENNTSVITRWLAICSVIHQVEIQWSR